MNMAEFPDIPIKLGIAHPRSRRWKSSKGGTLQGDVPKSLRDAVFERDQYFCRCCGFRSRKYQQVVVLDGNVRDIDSMITACIFCHQCFELDSVQRWRSGVLIWLPEVDQATLHHVARDIYRARITQGPMAQKARLILDRLRDSNRSEGEGSQKTRSEEARERLGTDDPSILAAMLRDDAIAQRKPELEQVLTGIRLFPLDRRIVAEASLEFNQFPQILAYWRSKGGPFHNETSYKWLDYIESISFSPEEISAVSVKLNEPVYHSHAQLAVKLLRDAAAFFKTLAEQNPAVRVKMKENSDVFEQVADLLEKDPTGRVEKSAGAESNQNTQDALPESQPDSSYARFAAKLLRDAADFFRTLAEQNQPIEEQMTMNARIFEQLADLVETDPTGQMQ